MPSYYREHEGFLVAAAIDKYVYVTVMRPFTEGIYLKYSQLEHVDRISRGQASDHPRDPERHGLQDPAGRDHDPRRHSRGNRARQLGQLHHGAAQGALHASPSPSAHRLELAELACHIEIDRLGEPVGKQDQYIAAVGGMTCFTFHKDDTVTATPLSISMDTMFDLEDNLLLFFTGFSRSAGSILKDQNTRTKQSDGDMLANLHYVKELGYRSKEALESGNTRLFGELMHEHWEHKKRRSGGMSNPKIDEWYELGMKNGAVGGKLVGAGGGGFLMFLAEDRNKLRRAMAHAGLEEVRFRFDFEGTKVVMSS